MFANIYIWFWGNICLATNSVQIIVIYAFNWWYNYDKTNIIWTCYIGYWSELKDKLKRTAKKIKRKKFEPQFQNLKCVFSLAFGLVC